MEGDRASSLSLLADDIVYEDDILPIMAVRPTTVMTESGGRGIGHRGA